MQYAILIHETAEQFDRRSDAEAHDAYMAPYHAYIASLREAGVLVGGEVLRGPATATTLRAKDGERQIQDGPVTNSHEQLGGFLIIEAENLDDAIRWAQQCPALVGGAVEVRPCGLETPE